MFSVCSAASSGQKILDLTERLVFFAQLFQVQLLLLGKPPVRWRRIHSGEDYG